MSGVILFALTLIVSIQAIYAASEIALLSANLYRIKALAKTDESYQIVEQLRKTPEKILAITLLITSSCVVSFAALLHLSEVISHPILSSLLSAPVILIAGELLPKSFAKRHATRLAPYAARLLAISYNILYPFTVTFTWISRSFSNLLRPLEKIIRGPDYNPRDELRYHLASLRVSNTDRKSENEMIKRIIDFRDARAAKAMIPLIRVDAIDEDATPDEIMRKFQEFRHSRLPVFHNRIDQLIGTISVQALFHRNTRDLSIGSLLEPAVYIPETQTITSVLRLMREEGQSMVVVVDEFGGSVGILTLEDIIEEVVGEIQDEYDLEKPSVRVISENRWNAEAKIELATLGEHLHVEFPKGAYHTLSGFLLVQFGRIPEVGDEIFLTIGSSPMRFQVRSAHANRIITVLIEKTEYDSST